MRIRTMRIMVSGRWRFPIDMLRYDRLSPASEADSSLIEASLQGNIRPTNEMAEPTRIDLIGHKVGTEGAPSSVTKDRWASFGWKVEAVNIA